MSEPLFSNNRATFGEAFLPQALLGRNEEMTELRRCLSPLAQQKPARNVWLHGPPGTGKSSAAKLLLNELEQQYGIQGVYVNCWEAETLHAVLDQAIRDLRILGAERLNTAFKLEQLEKGLRGRPLVIVLDEFDKPAPKEQESMIYCLCQIPKVALICITSSRSSYQALDERAKSRLDPELIEFRPYTVEQIKAILRDRVEILPGPTNVDEAVVARIAKLASGDARIALRTLQHAVVTAQKAGAKRIELRHVKTGHGMTLDTRRRYLLEKLGPHHSLIYRIIEDRGELESGGLWRRYSVRCRRARLRPAAPRTFSLYLKRLIDWNLIAHRRQLGTKGNIRVFRLRDGPR